MNVVNPFEVAGEAARYQSYRPRYHHLPFGMIRNLLMKDLDCSLDVACGTGHSTIALSKISRRVIGCDQSESMLAEARTSSAINYVRADAECLPFTDKTFDFLNVSMGFHWLNQERFLREATRVLKQGGYLSVDSYGFTGKISEDPGKQKAHYDLFEEYLPPPGMRNRYPTEEAAALADLEPVRELKYEHVVRMTSNEFTNLIMTWSNFQVLNPDKKQATAQKMKEVYETIFANQTLELPFSGKAILYQLSYKK